MPTFILMSLLFKRATLHDMVCVQEGDDHNMRTFSTCFSAREVFTKSGRISYNEQDLALAEALATFGEEFPHKDTRNTNLPISYYTDDFGCWCVECGGGVYPHEHDGDPEDGMMCANPSCELYDAQACPPWAKEFHNVA